ncbi:hypothetical protein N0V88_007326 [Collariella sp. IMI 366227]|nr:hypothetical protein N0V88_007326 [Collariella sp. IMI 366227]
MTVLQNFPQSWRRLIFLLPVLVISLILATGLYNGAIPKPTIPKVAFGDSSSHQKCGDGSAPAALHSVSDLIRAVWASRVLPIDAPSFTTYDGETKHLTKPLIHTQPLGKRLCILDVDNRRLDEEGHVFSHTPPTWDNLQYQSAGFLSHYLYAQIHGYEYRFVRAPKYADRAPHWGKVVFTKELLKEFDVVVMVDYDAMFTQPEVPLEWLMNYWNIGPEVLVAMAEDPAGDPNFDIRGKPNVNTGFIIAQAGDKTQRLFKDWAECPSETRYPGCAEWKDKPFHEQSGFSSYVRYDFLDGLDIDKNPEYMRFLPCKEANGYPEVKGCGCLGQFVRHYWGLKATTNREFARGVMSALTPLLVEAAFAEQGHVTDLRHKTLDGAEVLG